MKIDNTDKDWKKILTPEQYHVLREQGTEMPFSGKYNSNKDDGDYRCAACHAVLFSSTAKFDSHSGWPSFTSPKDREHVKLESDSSLGVIRTEVRCRNCNSHLGHVFDDGPTKDGGQRYCINSAALDFEKKAT